MNHIEWYRQSASGECTIYSQMYTCDQPKAILQIAHGMTERSGRYKDFMQFLAKQGYVVCANDHLGHGKSSHGEFGVFAKKPGGFDFIIEDIHTLFECVGKQYPNTPMILLGQSMGSILSALFADRHDYLSKLILMGTPQYVKFIDVMEKSLAKSVRKNGYTHTSKLWNRLIFGNEPTEKRKKIKHYSWLTSDEKIVEEFVEDDLSGAKFSDSANFEMMSGLRKWGNGDWGKHVPDIPILFIAGTKDKIAGYGKGTKYYYSLLKDTHTKLTLKLIDGDRHEVLNEKNRAETYQYILNWLSN